MPRSRGLALEFYNAIRYQETFPRMHEIAHQR